MVVVASAPKAAASSTSTSTVPPRGLGTRRVARRFVANRLALVSLFFILAIVLAALLAPIIAPHDPNEQQLLDRFASASSDHWLGTDEFGRDVLSRTIHGARASLLASVVAVAVGLGLGVPFGLVAGYCGRWIDAILSRLNDTLMAMPGLILAITFIAVMGPGIVTAMFAVGLVLTPRFFRVARAAAQTTRHDVFIESSQAIGCRTSRILRRHLLPNVASPIIVQVSLAAGSAMVAEASLSFLSLGVQPPTSSWGTMIRSGFDYPDAPLVATVPGGMIVLMVLALTFVGDGWRDALGTTALPMRRSFRRTTRDALAAHAVPPAPLSASASASASERVR